MESISVFDILKIGIGPSSSHTMGPWKAVQQCLEEYAQLHDILEIQSINVHLFGSLAKTGPGHGTNKAIMLGIMGFDPASIDCDQIDEIIKQIKDLHKILILGKKEIDFHPQENIIFKTKEQLPFHSNALKVLISHGESHVYEDIFYSIGGGFVVKGPADPEMDIPKLPFPIE